MSVRRRILRLVSRALRLVLPRNVHRRLAAAAKAAIRAYRAGDATASDAGSSPMAWPAPPFTEEAVHAQRGGEGGGQPYATAPASDGSGLLVWSSAPGAIPERPVPAEPGERLPAPPFAYPPPVTGRDTLAEPTGFVGCGGDHLPPGPYLDKSADCETQETKLVLCCAFTGRHRIVEKIVVESLLANHGKDVRWMLAGSSEEDFALIEALARSTGRVAGVRVENRPLGRKWQTCFYLASRYYSADLYGICGSDDFVSSRLVDHIIGRHAASMENSDTATFLPAMYGTLEWLVCDTNPQSGPVQIVRCNYAYQSAFEPLGAGRFYTRRFVEECGGLIFESDKERLLDDRGFFEAMDRGYSLEYYTLQDGPLVSVKGDWAQMNTLEDIVAAPTLSIAEDSFAGAALLAKSLSADSFKYLFKAGPLKPQLTFTVQPTGLAPRQGRLDAG